MGAVTFSLDPELLAVLGGEVSFTTFVETGTFRGDSIKVVQGRVPRVISVESDARLAAEASVAFADDASVLIVSASGAEALLELRPELDGQDVLFWLDAHWCAMPDGDAPAESQCDLITEIDAIGRLSDNSVVLIDDARLFLSPPPAPHDAAQWPRLHEVLDALTKVSPTHELAVVNDVIAFFPPRLAPALSRFAVSHGVDWLTVAEKARSYDVLLGDNLAKEQVIQALAAAADPEAPSAWEELSQRQAEQSGTVAGPPRGLLMSRPPWTRKVTRRTVTRVPVVAARRGGATARRLLARPFVLEQYEPRPPGMGLRDNHAPTPSTGLPGIAVAMPSFNQARYLEASIRSVLDQRYPGLQFVVQDGGSQDDSMSVVDRYRDWISSAGNEPDTGQAEAINRAFARTDAEIMGWLNSDDLLLPGALEAIGGYFARHPHVDVVYASRLIIDETGLEVGRWVMPPNAHEYLHWADYIPQETLYWRRSLWERVGGRVDQSMRFALDWDLLLRFVDAGARFACLPHVLGAFRLHSLSKTVGSIEQVGAEEMGAIRRRRHGRDVTPHEINSALLPLYLSAWRARAGWGSPRG